MSQKNIIEVIIPAAGLGKRFRSSDLKQYNLIGHETVLEKIVNLFLSMSEIQKVYISIDPKDNQINSQSFINNSKVIITPGGPTRSHSVNNALSKINVKEVDFIVIHDAVRPWLKVDHFNFLLNELIKDSEVHGIYPLISIADSIRRKSKGQFVSVDRDEFFLVQTPQIFHSLALFEALNLLINSNENMTDEAQALEKAGFVVKAVTGDRENSKITFNSDLPKTFSSDIRFGRGIDFHRFKSGNGFVLGSIPIDCNLSIVSHSDGDILLHALADALLGAGGFNDIGYYFPDTDSVNKNMNSLRILEKSLALLLERKLKPLNVDCVIVCEEPKIFPYVDAIKTALASLLKIHESVIGIKATTTERMGIIGRGNGIAVYAIAALEKMD